MSIVKPEASILIPVYNTGNTISKCIESILSQSFKDFELLIVDDGSTDDTPEILAAWKEKDKRIRIIRQENGGVSKARNTLIDNSEGKYIFFVDSDDTVKDGFLSKPIKAMEENDADICIFGFVSSFVDEGKKKNHNCQKTKVLSKVDAMKGLLKDGYINNLPWNKCYKKEVFSDVRYPEGLVFEDVYSTCRLFENADKICIIPDLLYEYEVQKDSITYKWWFNEKKVKDYLAARIEQFAFTSEHYPEILNMSYAATAHASLIAVLHLENNDSTKKTAESFLIDNKTEIIHSGFPFGMLFRLYYYFPNFVKKHAGAFGL